MSYYITKAQVPADNTALYVNRASDTQFDEYLRRNDYIAVIGPRVSGKTSLLARKFHELESRLRYLPIYVNLSLLSRLEEKAWYQRLHSSIIEGTRGKVNPTTLAIYELDLRDALLDMLEDQLKSQVLVIMLDDVEAIPQPILTPLMAMIREIFSSRGVVDAFKRCVFVLAGCFLPDDLIADPSISPFRIAERIHMLDASLPGVAQLANLLATPDRPVPEWLAERIFSWTEGDLYLTQRFCALLDQCPELTPELVDQIAEYKLTEDDIFHRVVRYLDKNPRLVAMLRRIQGGGSAVRFTRLQRLIAEAWLAGILKEDVGGNCSIRNRVYQTFIDLVSPSSLMSLPPSTPAFRIDPPTQSGVNEDNEERTIVIEKVVLNQRYVVETPSGEGGMAKVFRATDITTREAVAIKRLLREFSSDPLLIQRFIREAEMLRQLDHPNIVRFIDIFTEDNSQYLVMEYVRGGNLSQLMHREGRSLALSTAINITLGITDALHHAHSLDIVHRDIKPGNVLLTPNLTPRLADFGIARFISKAPLTEAGVLVGTISYMSPEACKGDTVMPSSDLWSLGVLVYEMLTGVLPFDGSNLPAVITAILSAPTPDIREIRKDVPESLAKIINRLLTRDFAGRFQSAEDLSAALRTVRV
jgi:tRNA A-37 threonylcarbamoyl transferase component Bud32